MLTRAAARPAPRAHAPPGAVHAPSSAKNERHAKDKDQKMGDAPDTPMMHWVRTRYAAAKAREVLDAEAALSPAQWFAVDPEKKRTCMESCCNLRFP